MRRLIAAAGLSVLLIPAIAPGVALAECTDWPIAANERVRVQYAFTATVADAWRDPEMVDDPDVDWRIDLAVERTYRGRVPDRITAKGWYFACHALKGEQLRTGDRIFVASSDFRPRADGLDPFTVIDGQVIVWKRSGDRWRFFEDGLDYGSDTSYYPRAARTATTTAAILRVVSGAAAPDTSTVSAPGHGDPRAVVPALALAFVAGFALAWKRLRSPPVSGSGP